METTTINAAARGSTAGPNRKDKHYKNSFGVKFCIRVRRKLDRNVARSITSSTLHGSPIIACGRRHEFPNWNFRKPLIRMHNEAGATGFETQYLRDGYAKWKRKKKCKGTARL